jgi:hypothetical protein
MALFQQTVLKKYIESLDSNKIDQQWEKFKSIFHNVEKQNNIRNSKEEQFQEGFLRELFVGVLGYTINPDENFNLLTELKNVANSKKADGAILIEGKAVAVIELKGTETTDLNKIEVQAFGYKNNQHNCTYVITSNFEKIRFYIENTIQQEEFNLFTLNKERFQLLYTCLSWESISKNIPIQILNESVSKENKITKDLYKDYSEFKRELFSSLVGLNPQYDKLLLFKKSQKLLDRFLFIFFAEDTSLLPTNLIFRINTEWQNLVASRVPVSLYDRYKMYFNDLNQGAKVTLPAFGKKTGEAITAEFEIFAYNGGLFQPDEILDTIKIDDTLLYNYTQKMSHYNFDSDVDVNILGHIFENSLNEIDEIKSEIEGNVLDKTKTRRKKDGVFYTPKYITKYIVDNTVGKLCSEKKIEIQLQDEDYVTDKKLQTKTKKALLDKLADYRNWLLQLTICDPACGSGAFLNQALEFLIAEHRYIDELQAKLMGDSMILSDVESSILENNIYGVDLNDESIEIAKLSLWLRTAQKGRKLNSLNNNIKCGNSLIDDVDIAGEKAFSWEKEFPDVFAKGGFDVVIGNPPYVRVEFIENETVNFYKNNYKSATSKFDLSSLFFEKSIDLINPNGYYSIITSYQFLYATSGIGLRKIISEKTTCEIIKFSSDSQIFEGATTYAGIFTIKRNPCDKIAIYEANNKLNSINILRHFNIPSIKFSEDKVIFDDTSVLEKIESNPKMILGKNIGMAKTGVVTSADDVFFLNEELIKQYNLEASLISPILGSSEMNSWFLSKPDTLCLYPYYEIEGKTILIPLNKIQSDYPNVYKYLIDNKKTLIARSQGRKDYSESENWYQLNRPREKWIYDSIKIIYPGTTNKPKFSLDNSGQMFRNARVYSYLLKEDFIDLYSIILPILNSQFSKYLMTLKCPPKANNYFEMSTGFMENFPFLIPDNSTKINFKTLGDKMLVLNREFYSILRKFSSYFSLQYRIEKLSGKLEKWYDLEFVDFIKELNKSIKTAKGTPLTKKDEFEWIDLFEENKQKALSLKAKIDKTDKEIDQMVYTLYELTEEEIKIVEGL